MSSHMRMIPSRTPKQGHIVFYLPYDMLRPMAGHEKITLALRLM